MGHNYDFENTFYIRVRKIHKTLLFINRYAYLHSKKDSLPKLIKIKLRTLQLTQEHTNVSTDVTTLIQPHYLRANLTPHNLQIETHVPDVVARLSSDFNRIITEPNEPTSESSHERIPLVPRTQTTFNSYKKCAANERTD